MTPEQVTKWKAWSYALLGAGVATFYMAYQYAQPVTGRAEPPPEFAPYMFGAIGVVCFIAAALVARKVSKQNVPAATTDLKAPQGKLVIGLLVAGMAALAGNYAVGYLVPNNENLQLALSLGLLAIMAICLISAGRVARNMRRAAATAAVVKSD